MKIKGILLSFTALLAVIALTFSLNSCSHHDKDSGLSIYKQWQIEVDGEEYYDLIAYDFTSRTDVYVLVHLIKDYRTIYKAGKWYSIESVPFKVEPQDKYKGLIYFGKDTEGTPYVITEKTLTIDDLTLKLTHGIKISGEIKE